MVDTNQVVKNAHQPDYVNVATINNAVKNATPIRYAKQVMKHITMDA